MRSDTARHGVANGAGSGRARPRWRALGLALGCTAVALLAARPATAQTCECRQTADGVCERWHDLRIGWQLYAPDGGPVLGGAPQTGIANADVEREAQAAFAAWQAVECSRCLQQVGDTCTAVDCPTHPLGLRFDYDGPATQPALATICLQQVQPGQPPAPCNGAAPGTSQVAFLRDETTWPAGEHVLSFAVLTVKKTSGRIVDGDILLRAGSPSLCLQDCADHQFPLRGVLLREVGHVLGLGDSDDAQAVLAANFEPDQGLAPALAASDQACVCSLYRDPDSPQACGIAAALSGDELAATGCTAAPTSTDPAAWSALALAALAALVAAARRTRRR